MVTDSELAECWRLTTKEAPAAVASGCSYEVGDKDHLIHELRAAVRLLAQSLIEAVTKLDTSHED